MDQKSLQALNAVYLPLESKRDALVQALSGRVWTAGWFNGHYHRGAAGEWVREAFPIPVISVKGLCDIEIQPGQISVSAKLRRDAALAYPFERLAGYTFEAYGVEDYLADYYRPGQPLQALRERIRACRETEIGFSFVFPFEAAAESVAALVALLERERFFY